MCGAVPGDGAGHVRVGTQAGGQDVGGLAGKRVHGTAITNTMRQMGGALINALLFALMGVATPALGEMGGIKLAFAVSTVAIALMGAWLIVNLAREKKGSAR